MVSRRRFIAASAAGIASAAVSRRAHSQVVGKLARLIVGFPPGGSSDVVIAVTTVSAFPFVLSVGPMVPREMRTLNDFIQWCKAHPGRASYGTSGAGSMLHFAGMMLARAANFESFEVGGMSPQEFGSLVRSDLARWEPIVRESGFTPEN